MRSLILGLSLAGAAAAIAAGSQPALAQRTATPEQRIERLERQVMQVQRRVFPQGQPADTAGFPTEPAATQASVSNLDNRLMTLERQMAEFLSQAETNGHRVTVLEAELVKLRRDQEQRIAELERALEARPARIETVAQEPVETAAAPTPRPAPATVREEQAPDVDEGEKAYDAGYQLWKAGKHEQAITALRAMSSSFPKHRRVSWANNLAGRAMLDMGQPRAAAEALLANYRSNPKGERAADSLYYLGQALMKLNQPGQACNAYAELESIYGANMRGELKTLLPKAKAEAKCSG